MVSPLDSIPVLNLLYAAALDNALWPDALAAIQRAVGASGAQLLFAGGAGQRNVFSVGFDPEQGMLYDRHYGRLDPVPAKLTPLLPGSIVSCSRIIGEEARKSAFFQEWADPNHVSDAVFLKLSPAGEALWALALGQSYRSKPFLDPSLGLFLETLAPHLVNALLIGRKLEAMSDEAHASKSWIDGLGSGWMLLSADRQLLCANEAALGMIRENDGILVQGRAVAVSDADANAALQKGIAAAGGSRNARDFGLPIFVRRPSGAKHYSIRVMPYRQDGLRETPGKVTIVITDPVREEARLARALRAEYDLTAAEVEVALRVGQGRGLHGVARDRGVSLSTVRVHLQHVFEKTGTHRQSELIVLMEGLRSRPLSR